jgi:hypothetical protein
MGPGVTVFNWLHILAAAPTDGALLVRVRQLVVGVGCGCWLM